MFVNKCPRYSLPGFQLVSAQSEKQHTHTKEVQLEEAYSHHAV